MKAVVLFLTGSIHVDDPEKSLGFLSFLAHKQSILSFGTNGQRNPCHGGWGNRDLVQRSVQHLIAIISGNLSPSVCRTLPFLGGFRDRMNLSVRRSQLRIPQHVKSVPSQAQCNNDQQRHPDASGGSFGSATWTDFCKTGDEFVTVAASSMTSAVI